MAWVAEIGCWTRRLFAASESDATGAALPVVYRLAVLYLLLPVAVWLLGWFEWWFAFPAVASIGASLWRMVSGSWRAPVGPATLVLPLFALSCCVLTAFGVFNPDTFDSVAHRAVFLDLVHSDWPAYLADYLSDEPPLLRYYLGYYMVPGLVGKWLGPGALNWAVPLWTWVGVALVLALAGRGLPTLRAMLLAAFVFVFFSGMDVLGYVLHDGLPDAVRRLAEQFGVEAPRFIRSPSSFEWAAYHAHGVGDIASIPAPASPMLLEYLSNAHVLAVTPQHFIGGGLTTLLMLRLRGNARFLPASGIVLVACLFWSSLVAVGLLPFVAAMVVKNGVRPFLGWRNLLLAPALAALLALYLASGQVDFPSGWLWELYASGSQLAVDMTIFYLAEFLVLALLLCWLWPRLGREPFFLAAVAVLLAAPWFWYGGPRFNEFFRVTFPSLFLLAYWAGHAVAERRPARPAQVTVDRGDSDGPRRWLASDVSARVVLALLIAVLSLGAVTPLFEFAKVDWQRIMPIGRMSPALLTDFDPTVVAQRTALSVPDALAFLLRESGDKSANAGEPFIRSGYDVYRDGNWLVYAKRDCDGEAEARRRFRLRVHPVASEEDGPRQRSAAINRDFFLGYRFMRSGNFGDAPYDGSRGCVVRARLPDGAIARIHTGQHEADGAVLWEAGYDFETSERFSSPDFYLPEYRAVVAGTPAAQSDFDVYLDDGRLAVLRAPCRAGDTAARFLVHLYAAKQEDLPGNRQPFGFDNFDFDFAAKGVSWDGKCLATIQLPDYAIDRVVVGQFVRVQDGIRDLWRVDFPTNRREGRG